MTTVTLDSTLNSQRWNLGSEPFASRLGVISTSTSRSIVFEGFGVDTDLKKVSSAFADYLSSPDRKGESFEKKLIDAQNAGQIFGKVVGHNQKVYDNFTLTILHVILAVLTLGLFSLRSQYVIDMPKADLLAGLRFDALSSDREEKLLESLSLRDFFLLSEERQKEFLESAKPAPFLKTVGDLPSYFSSLKKLPLDVQAAIRMDLFFYIVWAGDLPCSDIIGGAINATIDALLKATDAQFLATPVESLLTLDEIATRVVAERLKGLPQGNDSTPLNPNISERTFGELSRFSPQEVMDFLLLLPQKPSDYTLFPPDLLLQAIFSERVLSDGVNSLLGISANSDGSAVGPLSSAARSALKAFFRDHRFHVDEVMVNSSSAIKKLPGNLAFEQPGKSFAEEIRSRQNIHYNLDHSELRNELGGYFAQFLNQKNINSVLMVFASDRLLLGIKSFFRCLRPETLDLCDWDHMPFIPQILFDYDKTRFMQLSQRSQIAILNRLGLEPKKLGGFRVPELLPDAFWKNLPPLEGESDTLKKGEYLTIAAQKVLFFPVEADEVVTAYHRRHFELIGEAKQKILSTNGAFV